VFEYFWDGDREVWVPWKLLVPQYVHRPELQFNQILVPTVDTVRATWILNILVKRQCPVCTRYVHFIMVVFERGKQAGGSPTPPPPLSVDPNF